MSLSSTVEMTTREIQKLSDKTDSASGGQCSQTASVFGKSASFSNGHDVRTSMGGEYQTSESVDSMPLNKRYARVLATSPRLQESCNNYHSEAYYEEEEDDVQVKTVVEPNQEVKRTKTVGFRDLLRSVDNMLTLLRIFEYRCSAQSFRMPALVHCAQMLGRREFMQLIKPDLMKIAPRFFCDNDIIPLLEKIRMMNLGNEIYWSDVKDLLAKLYGEILYEIRFTGNSTGYHSEVCDVLMSLLKDFVGTEDMAADDIYKFLTNVRVKKSKTGMFIAKKNTELVKQIGSAMRDRDFKLRDRPQYAAGVLPLLISYGHLVTILYHEGSPDVVSGAYRLHRQVHTKIKEFERDIGDSNNQYSRQLENQWSKAQDQEMARCEYSRVDIQDAIQAANREVIKISSRIGCNRL